MHTRCFHYVIMDVQPFCVKISDNFFLKKCDGFDTINDGITAVKPTFKGLCIFYSVQQKTCCGLKNFWLHQQIKHSMLKII